MNSYGEAVHYLQAALDERDINKPYIVTEFEVTGEWDIKNERHGIKLGPSDTEKYNTVAYGYKDWILNKPSCLGVYVFHYSSGNGHMGRWFLTHVGHLKRFQY